MEENEWRQFYQYLLAKLREMQLTEVVNEVEYAATQRIIEDANEQNGQLALFRDLDTTTSRARQPSEAVNAALSVLQTRLQEFPAVVAALEVRLSRESSHILWKPDVDQGEIGATGDEFTAAELQINDDESTQIRIVIHQLLTH